MMSERGPHVMGASFYWHGNVTSGVIPRSDTTSNTATSNLPEASLLVTAPPLRRMTPSDARIKGE